MYRITNWLVRSTNSKVNITFHTYITIQFIIDTISKVMITFHTILLNQIARSTKILEERCCSSVVEHWMSKQVDWGSNPSIYRLFYLNCTRNFRKLSKRWKLPFKDITFWKVNFTFQYVIFVTEIDGKNLFFITSLKVNFTF